MELKKLTSKYNLYEEAGTYFLAFGAIKKGEDTTTKIRFENVDAKVFTITPTCGCTTSKKTIIDEKTVEAEIKISTTGIFKKTVTLKNGRETKYLKLTGTAL